MHLYLSSKTPWNANYCTEQGQVIYKVNSSFKFVSRRATIHKIEVPFTFTLTDETQDARTSGSSGRESEDDLLEQEDEHFESRLEPDMRDRFALLAEFQLQRLGTSKITMIKNDEPEKKNVSELFTLKEWGWGAFGRNRSFVGPDGNEYQWELQTIKPKLFRISGPTSSGNSKTLIANYHRRNLGIVNANNKRPASLEVYPEGERMLDLIVVTFVYVEWLRKGRERAAKWQGGGGGP